MNTNFSPFKIVNTYGAFGSITKKRTEIILEGTRASLADVMGENGLRRRLQSSGPVRIQVQARA